MERLQKIQNKGYEVRAIWECDVDSQIKSNPKMKEHFNDMCVRGRIDPRDAFSGGFTQAFKMLEEAEEGYEISHYDIISLYPACNFYGPYPVGHPEIKYPEGSTHVNWNRPEDIPYRGLIKV